jgi:hypothetical protein
MGAATLLALVGEFKLVKTKKRCCKSRPRCKKCPVTCKRLEMEGLAMRQDKRHYLVELGIGKKAFKAARAR